MLLLQHSTHTETGVSNLTARIQGEGAKLETNKMTMKDEEAGYNVAHIDLEAMASILVVVHGSGW